MKTKLIEFNSNRENINLIKETIQSGELIAFPTETVYGLGADGLNEEAVKKMADALERWIKEDIDAVMNEYNKKPAKPKKEKAPKAEEGAEVKAEIKTEEKAENTEA